MSDLENKDQAPVSAEDSTPPTDSGTSTFSDKEAYESDKQSVKKFAPFIGGRNSTEPNDSAYYKDFARYNEEQNAKEAASADGGKTNRTISMLLLLAIVIAYILYAFVFRDRVSCANDQARYRLDGDVPVVGYVEGSSDYTANLENLQVAMDSFYDTTGVRAYILDLTGEETLTADELQARADEFYKETFTDERHFLIAFQAGSETIAMYHVGTEAAQLMDEDGVKIFDDYMGQYYGSKNVSESDMFVYVFEGASRELMNSLPKSIIFIIVLGALIAYGVITLYRNMKKGGLTGSLRRR